MYDQCVGPVDVGHWGWSRWFYLIRYRVINLVLFFLLPLHPLFCSFFESFFIIVSIRCTTEILEWYYIVYAGFHTGYFGENCRYGL